MNEQNEKLKNEVKKLKKSLKDKEAIIETLLLQLDSDRKKDDSKNTLEYNNLENIKNQLKTILDQNVDERVVHEKKKLETREDTICSTKAQKEYSQEFDYYKTVRELKELINFNKISKKEVKFKQNLDFEGFINYCLNQAVCSVSEDNSYQTQKPVKYFIELNIKGILKFLFDNINERKVGEIYSTLYVLGNELGYDVKIIILHDLFLFLENRSLLVFFVFALFENERFKDDCLSVTLKILLEFQLFTDRVTFSNEQLILDAFNKISEKLRIKSQRYDIESYCYELVKDLSFLEDNEINKELVYKATAIKVICDFLDWDWTYNIFIVDFLYPKFIKETRPAYLYIIGLLALNGLRNLGMEESVICIFDEIEKYIYNEDVLLGVVAYLFIKQIKPLKMCTWFKEFEKKIEDKLKIDPEYIKSMLLF